MIAFTATAAGSIVSSIYAINPDGSGQIRLTNDAFGESDPAWSPDHRHIAYVSMAGGFADLFVMNADGSGQHRVRDGTDVGNATFPTWSPDGREIAYVCGCGEFRAIRPDGTGDRLIWDPDPGPTGGPDRIGSVQDAPISFSPDGPGWPWRSARVAPDSRARSGPSGPTAPTPPA